MRIPMSIACKQIQPFVSFRGGTGPILNMEPFFRRKYKVVVIMGATGTGKSRLAIELATQFPAEIINSDKIQVYKGLDIVTNKVTDEECQGVPHHLMSVVDDPNSNFTATDFCHHASLAIESIIGRYRVPIIAGGSNSFIEELVNKQAEFLMKYECRFLWVDVSLDVLHSFVSKRVDRMVEAGLIEEVRKLFDPDQAVDYNIGLRRAIGVPELDEYLRIESMKSYDEETKAKVLKSSIDKIKENTYKLAHRQLQKIHRLQRQWDWKMHRLEATEAFLKRGKLESDEAWERHVAGPGTKIVDGFLFDEGLATINVPSNTTSVFASSVNMPAVAAATR